jgi:hypothetical protein
MKPLVDAAFRVQAGTNPPDYNSRRRNIKPITVLLSERSRFGRAPGQQQSQVAELCRRAHKRLDGSCECSLHGPRSLAASTTAIAGKRPSQALPAAHSAPHIQRRCTSRAAPRPTLHLPALPSQTGKRAQRNACLGKRLPPLTDGEGWPVSGVGIRYQAPFR